MPIPQALLKTGVLLYDHATTTFPAHRRIYRLAALPKDGKLQLTHVASGASRTVAVGAPGLALVPDLPDLAANLDCLVGQRVSLKLHTGSTLSGYCTGIHYHEVHLGDKVVRQVKSIELDHSGSSTFPWAAISGCKVK